MSGLGTYDFLHGPGRQRVVLAHGADPGVKDDWGEDAFSYADDETVSNDTIRALLTEWARRA